MAAIDPAGELNILPSAWQYTARSAQQALGQAHLLTTGAAAAGQIAQGDMAGAKSTLTALAPPGPNGPQPAAPPPVPQAPPGGWQMPPVHPPENTSLPSPAAIQAQLGGASNVDQMPGYAPLDPAVAHQVMQQNNAGSWKDILKSYVPQSTLQHIPNSPVLPLRDIVSSVTSPAGIVGTLAPVGDAADIGMAAGRALLPSAAAAAGKIAVGTGAAVDASRGLAKVAGANIPVLSGIAGNPVVQQALPLVAFAGGDALASHIASLPQAVAKSAAAAGLVPEGAVPFSAGIQDVPPQSEPFSDMPPLHATPDAAGGGSPPVESAPASEAGSAPGVAYSVPGPGGKPFEVSPVTTAQSGRVIQNFTDELARNPQPIMDKLPPMIQEKGNSVVALLNPAVKEDRDVLVGARSAQAAASGAVSQFSQALHDPVQAVIDAFNKAAPEYIGDAPKTPGQAILVNTIKDVAERPFAYRVSPDLTQALANLAHAMWQNADAARSYGVDVTPRVPEGGGIHLPNVDSTWGDDERFQHMAEQMGLPGLEGERGAPASGSGGSNYGASGITKTRAYQTAWDRSANNPAFNPETDLKALADYHTSGLGRAIQNSTFRQAIGGLTQREAVEAERPDLVGERDAVTALVNSLQGRVQTAGKRLTDYTNLTARADTFVKQQSARYDDLTQRATDRSLADDDRVQAARQALAEARANLSQARLTALSTYTKLGAQRLADTQSQAEVTRLAKQAQALDGRMAAIDKQIAQAKAAGDTLNGAGIPSQMASTGAEQAKLLSQLNDLTAQGLHIPQGDAAATANDSYLRRGIAEIAAKQSGTDLAQAERDAINAAQAKGVNPTPLAHMEGRIQEIERQLRDARRTSDAGGAKAANTRQLLEGLQSALDDVRDRKATLDNSYKSVRLSNTVRNRFTNLYHAPDTSAAIDKFATARGANGIQQALDSFRNTVFLGHLTPSVQSAMAGFLQSPVVTTRSVMAMLRDGSAERSFLDANPDVAQRFGEAFGRPIGVEEGPQAEFRRVTLFDRIPKLRNAVDTVQDSAYAAQQGILARQFVNDSRLLQRMNPGMTQAAADQEAARALGNLMFSRNELFSRGITPARAQAERSIVSSTSFALGPAATLKDATSGLVKLGAARTINPSEAWQSLSGREQLALLRTLQMTGTVAALTGASAIASAQSRGMSPLKAVQDAFNPTSARFMSIQIGKGNSLPLASPFRSFVRALSPGYNGIPGEGFLQWAYSKLTPPVSVAEDLIRNKDWQGKAILTSRWPMNFVQGARFAAINGLPVALGEGLQGTPSGSAGSIASQVGGAVLGERVSLASPTEQMDQKARAQGFQSYSAAGPKEQALLRQQNPELWQQKLAQASTATQQYYAVKTNVQNTQKTADASLLEGKISLKDWQDATASNGAQLAGAAQALFKSTGQQSANALAQFYQWENSQQQSTGVPPDYAQEQAYLAKLPAADQQYIASERGSQDTPVQKLRQQIQQQYYAIPHYAGLTPDQSQQVEQAFNDVMTATPVFNEKMMLYTLFTDPDLQNLPPDVQAFTAMKIMQKLPINPDLFSYEIQHPEVAFANKTGTLSPQTRATLIEMLAKQSGISTAAELQKLTSGGS